MRVKYLFSSRRTGHIENMRKQKMKHTEFATEIVKQSDIVLEVLDARFIEETRNKEQEALIKSQGKKVIYVLNKTDLIKKERIMSQIRGTDVYPYVFVSCSLRKGARELRSRIKQEAKKLLMQKKSQPKNEDNTELDNRINVGVIGYPNTGKSSLINFLAGRSSAGVGSEAGFTKGFQKIKLSSDILLIDSPGIIPGSEYSPSEMEKISRHAKVSARSYNQVREPEIVVNNIFKDAKEQIEKHYGIVSEDTEDFLEKLGRKIHFMKKGNEVDTDRVARKVLKDWQKGEIRL